VTEERLPKRTSWIIISLWSLVGGLIGIVFWELLHYWRRVLKQPLLAPNIIPTDIENHGTIATRALHIAASNLRAGIERRRLTNGQEKLVLCAGVRNFREPWARDFGFASFGLAELEEYQALREGLEAFLVNQRPTGQFPVKIHSTNIVDRYLHSFLKREQPNNTPIKPKYITAHNTISLDGNALLVIAALNYAVQAGDTGFGRGHWSGLKQAIIWLEDHALEADGLLYQAAFADWADSIARRGRVLYTNVIYWKALVELAATAPMFGDASDQRYFEAKARQLKDSINDHFWRPDLGYYVTNYLFDNLSSGGNLLAIAWGLTSPEQAHAILDNMDRFGMADSVPTQVVHRAYPRKFIALENRLGGIGHYHTSASWLWLGAWHVIASTRTGRQAEAETLLCRISKAIVRDGAVHEVYGPDGHYLSSFWYTSEAPLTWSAGMVVHAHHVFRRHMARQSDWQDTSIDARCIRQSQT